MFFEKDTIKNFAIFTRKHLCWGLFLIKLQVLRSATFLKTDSSTGVSSGCCKIFKNIFLIQHLWWLLLTVYHDTVKSAGVLVFWFRASTCIWFWSKNFKKRCTNNSLLSRDKAISSLLELNGHVFSISEYLLEKHWLLSILMKNLQNALHK